MVQKLMVCVLALASAACSSGKEQKLEELLKRSQENMVFVKGGTFMMGDIGGLDNEDKKYGDERWPLGTPENKKKYPDAPWQSITGEPGNIPHEVTLSDYSISKYEVTWEEFDTFYELTNRAAYKKENKDYGTYWRAPTYPVRAPNWTEAKAYCRFLAKHSGLNYDLPTEAQWEYAARNRGEYIAYATDTGWADIYEAIPGEGRVLHRQQNVAEKSHPVGSFPPNPLGLYDMTGNRGEWVNDWYSETYFQEAPITDPRGPTTGTLKVIRDSSSSDIQYMSVYERYGDTIGRRHQGFRCALNP